MKILRRVIVALLFAVTSSLITSTTVHAQTAAVESCFPVSLPNTAQPSPVTFTLWCQIVEPTGAAPLASSYDSGLLQLYQPFAASVLHIEYDDWYAAMDSVFQFEVLRSSSDIVTVPIAVHYTGATWIADIPLSLSASAGDRLRITQQSAIPHPCGLIDNCGMHVVFTFQ